MLPLYNFSHNNTDLIDTALLDGPSTLPSYRQPSVDNHPLSTLSLAYSYDPLTIPQHLHSPVPFHLSNIRTQTDPVRAPTPVQDANLTSRQLICPTTQRAVHHSPPPPGPHSTDTTPPSSMLDYYASTSQPLFPTPSELLSAVSHRRQSFHRGILSESRPYLHSATPPRTSRQQSPDDPSAVPLNTAVNKTESLRKARQRAIAEEIGFTPTDPDTISSHEKKRHYLECLEQYVLYLHEQLRLVQTSPLALERVSTYRGLSSRSIRTLLVHMQNTNKTLHEGILTEEQVFLDLSAQVMAAHTAGLPLRRHSVDTVGVSQNSDRHSNLSAFDPISSLLPDDMTASASPSSADRSSASPDTSSDPATQRFIFPGPGDGM